MITSLCHSVAETEALAVEFSRTLQSGAWVGLIGPLGAGKSVFARAVGRAVGVRGEMPSPTYTLMTVHTGRCPVYHMDMYRISSDAELEFAGILPYFSGPGICLVEWAERVRSAWPPAGWIVTIAITRDSDRSIEIARFGPATNRQDGT
ncbi:MAG: tRNA (adenosine(37)-N6)-threonylcarbamoyltransferase complex ATPase subunit type 1 TsaE [candidate division Zixibacteria bacterium]|nr:tRNA (adenosine(37)-N6)-threonylcarbamoyltransferase complex ATPase subunit type 1 TsaE [candidate division Zixibacteria bacterium]